MGVVLGWARGEDAEGLVSIRAWFDPRIPQRLETSFETAFAWINHVHGVTDPELLFRWQHLGALGKRHTNLGRECVGVAEDDRSDVYGSYIPSCRNSEETSIGPQMTINPALSGKAATIAHECLHLIHREILHIDRGMSRNTASRLVLLFRFIHSTSSYKESLRKAANIRAVYENLRQRNSTDPATMREIADTGAAVALADYYMLDEEWLARSYSHMIQNRAITWRDNPFPIPSRERDPIEGWLPVYLTEHDIWKFDRKTAKLFRQLGWRKVIDHTIP